jgi:hypothetical protein
LREVAAGEFRVHQGERRTRVIVLHDSRGRVDRL